VQRARWLAGASIAPYDRESIRSLFDEMASTYSYINLISSFGFAAWCRSIA